MVSAVSVPCVATLASLVDEFGRRAALGISVGILGVGIATGAVIARVVV